MLALRSLDCAVFTQSASVFPDYPHFFPTETCILDRHAKEQVFILLVVGGKCVLMEQHQFRFIRAGFREVGKVRSNGRDRRDTRRMRSSLVIVL
jgi:hypothetical protein